MSRLASFVAGCAVTAFALNLRTIWSWLGSEGVGLVADSLIFAGIGLFVVILLLVGLAWVRRRSSNRRKWTLGPGPDDFVARQRRFFPFLVSGDVTYGPLSVSQWLEHESGRKSSWTREDVSQAAAAQVATVFRGLDAERPHRAALAVMFALKIWHSNKYEDVRNTLARAWDPKTGLGQEKAERVSRRIVARFMSDERHRSIHHLVQECMVRHGWSETVLMALLDKALRVGTISGAEYGWLKLVDRPLFYALNAVGRPSFLPESIGVACHYHAEKLHGAALHTPYVTPAVEGIMRTLAKESEHEVVAG